MNRQGHGETLVAAQTGNKNAIKAGVFSATALTPRIAELDAAIAERPPAEVAKDLRRRELAALATLGEAMDRSLEEDGIRGRRGDPRSLISLRLRVNEKLRRTLDEYEQAAKCDNAPPGGDLRSAGGDAVSDDAVPGPLPVTLAWLHGRPTLDAISAADVDPECFLRAIIITPDELVTTGDRLRARRMLTRRAADRASTCVCVATLKARDELELRDWIDLFREAGVEVNASDAEDAALVRRLARGDRSMVCGRNWRRYWSTVEAFGEVIRLGVARSRRESVRMPGGSHTRDDDAAVRPFWRTLLSPDETLAPRERVRAFAALDEMNVFPKCTCDRKKAPLADDWGAWRIHMVTQKHYRAAGVIAQCPETYLAIRDAIDAAIVEERATSNDLASAPLEAVGSAVFEAGDDVRETHLESAHQQVAEEEKLDWIRRAWSELSEPFTEAAYTSWRRERLADAATAVPTLSVIQKTFGGWDRACDRALPGRAFAGEVAALPLRD